MIYSGASKIESLYLGSTNIGAAYLGSVKVYSSTPVDPYNPLGLPPFTMRVEFYGPDAELDPSALNMVLGTWTQVSGSVWDWTYQDTNWDLAMSYSFNNTRRNICQTYRFNVLGANTTGVTDMDRLFSKGKYIQSLPLFDTSSVTTMDNFIQNTKNSNSVLTTLPKFDTSKVTNFTSMCEGNVNLINVPKFDISSATTLTRMFYQCTGLQTVPLFDLPSTATSTDFMFCQCASLQTAPLFDLSSVTVASNMFTGCTSLRTVPLFDTSSMTKVDGMFNGCTNVESGALTLYQQMSTQANPPTRVTNCFKNCGSGSTAGAAELAEIPASWGGTGEG